MSDRYVLILVSLNPDDTDLSGIKYPLSGRVESRRYKPDDNILNGLYGILWGKTNKNRWVNSDIDAKYKVVRTEKNDEIVPLCNEYKFVKFRSGLVVFSGCLRDCYRYILENSPEEYKDNLAKNIAEVEETIMT